MVWLKRFILVVLVVVAATYSTLRLPRHFGGQGFLQLYVLVVFGAGLTWTVVVWRLRSFDRAMAAGLTLVAALFALFWPGVEVAFQHVDGGGMSSSQNAVFLTSVALSLIALGASLAIVARPALGCGLLTLATAGAILVGLFAPDSSPSAHDELTLAVPLLVVATAASWLVAGRQGRGQFAA